MYFAKQPFLPLLIIKFVLQTASGKLVRNSSLCPLSLSKNVKRWSMYWLQEGFQEACRAPCSQCSMCISLLLHCAQGTHPQEHCCYHRRQAFSWTIATQTPQASHVTQGKTIWKVEEISRITLSAKAAIQSNEMEDLLSSWCVAHIIEKGIESHAKNCSQNLIGVLFRQEYNIHGLKMPMITTMKTHATGGHACAHYGDSQ